MPELPEVECVRRSLAGHLVGRRVVDVRVNRRDVVRGNAGPGALLVGERITQVLRHGKQLAIVGAGGACVAVHLGMSGQLCIVPRAGGLDQDITPLQRPKGGSGSASFRGSLDVRDLPAHTHVIWAIESGAVVRFTDPRRFGGVWSFAQLDKLIEQRWAKLGPDALTVTPSKLMQRLSGTTRGLKAALLDQALVAGLGNIYVDELLFTMRLHPLLPAGRLDHRLGATLVRQMRSLLNGAVQRGGSSLRDYVDADNRRGTQQNRHRVYGRSGEPCKRRRCGQTLVSQQIAGRTTTWCPSCQPLAGHSLI